MPGFVSIQEKLMKIKKKKIKKPLYPGRRVDCQPHSQPGMQLGEVKHCQQPPRGVGIWRAKDSSEEGEESLRD